MSSSITRNYAIKMLQKISWNDQAALVSPRKMF